jgi:hypothetical protein
LRSNDTDDDEYDALTIKDFLTEVCKTRKCKPIENVIKYLGVPLRWKKYRK